MLPSLIRSCACCATVSVYGSLARLMILHAASCHVSPHYLPTVICSRDNQVEKHTGPLPHSSDGSNDKIEVYRNHFTALSKELKHIQIKEEI